MELSEQLKTGMCAQIGNTPLIKIPKLSEWSSCEVLGKAEFLNPGGSVKDRAALGIIQEAIASGALGPGGVVVEGSAGNTGIGLAHICSQLSLCCIVVIPETQSPEKMRILKALGTDLRVVPAQPYSSEEHFTKIARRIAEETPGAIWANQFENTANQQFHYRTTGPEILDQCRGEIDYFVSAVGTGGTLGGVARYLKEHSPSTRVILADPPGSALFNFIKNGELKAEGSSITEGIGIGRITANLKDVPIDDAIQISDDRTISMLHHLSQKEGLLLGSSAALNLCAAVEIAQSARKGSRIVTILCDGADRYYSRLYNEQWRSEKDLEPKELTPQATGKEVQ